MATGLWNLGSFNLPDLGITEALGLGTPNAAITGGQVSTWKPEQNTTPQNTVPYAPVTNSGSVYVNPNKTQTSAPSPVPAPTPSRAPQQSSDGGFSMDYYPGWRETEARADWLATGGAKGRTQQQTSDPYEALRGEINSGWDNYINSLNDQFGDLEGQRSSQETIANANINQNAEDLGLQLGQGLTQLGTQREAIGTNQSKTLRDLSSNLRNSFMAGNVYLGTRGAGDSSAANQYAMALTKEGSRQRSDIMQSGADQLNQIALKETDLNNIYNTEKNKLEQVRQSKVAEISNWFYGAQQQIKQAQATGQLNKSQDLQSLSKGILDQAISAMNQIKSETSNRNQALESWAISQSKNINDLKSNMQGISQFQATLPQAGQIAGSPQVDSSGNITTSFTGAGRGKTWDERLQRYV